MFFECNKCHQDSIIPCHMGCGHMFCFLCLNDITICTICNASTGFMPNNLPGNKNYLWLYGSNHSGMWWCYDNNSNELIEQLYQQTININEDDKIKLVLTKKTDVTAQINIPQFSTVNMSNDSNSSNLIVNFSDDNLTDKEIHSVHQISSIIKIEDQYYEIDLNKMYQYNMIDKNKKRRIKRIEVPTNISKGNLPGVKSYLSDENILGISGKLFNLK